MGICISLASSEIHGVPEEVHDENVTIFESNKVLNGNKRLCSVYSKQGTKGLNQDAASLYQVCLFIPCFEILIQLILKSESVLAISFCG